MYEMRANLWIIFGWKTCLIKLTYQFIDTIYPIIISIITTPLSLVLKGEIQSVLWISLTGAIISSPLLLVYRYLYIFQYLLSA